MSRLTPNRLTLCTAALAVAAAMAVPIACGVCPTPMPPGFAGAPLSDTVAGVPATSNELAN